MLTAQGQGRLPLVGQTPTSLRPKELGWGCGAEGSGRALVVLLNAFGKTVQLKFHCPASPCKHQRSVCAIKNKPGDLLRICGQVQSASQAVAAPIWTPPSLKWTYRGPTEQCLGQICFNFASNRHRTAEGDNGLEVDDATAQPLHCQGQEPPSFGANSGQQCSQEQECSDSSKKRPSRGRKS